jgi:hypothetical protein
MTALQVEVLGELVEKKERELRLIFLILVKTITTTMNLIQTVFRNWKT